jgi:serine/threonine protein kinase
MGQIFRALDVKTGWHVAVKVLPKKSVNADSIRRFRREGQAALRVQHPHIVHTFHLGQHGDTFFLATGRFGWTGPVLILLPSTL